MVLTNYRFMSNLKLRILDLENLLIAEEPNGYFAPD